MEADGNHVLLNHHWRVCLLNHLTMYDDFQHGNHVLLNHLIIIYNNRKKSFWKLFYVGMLGLLLISLGCSAIFSIASYENYPSGFGIKKLHQAALAGLEACRSTELGDCIQLSYAHEALAGLGFILDGKD
ncbi:hypothetical protein Droror1_Dr00024501 [Drosera rotundifolia]